jgi:hypothetical protein
LGERLKSHDPVCAAPIVDEDLLAQPLGEVSRDMTRDGVGPTTGSEWYYHLDRFLGPALSQARQLATQKQGEGDRNAPQDVHVLLPS